MALLKELYLTTEDTENTEKITEIFMKVKPRVLFCEV